MGFSNPLDGLRFCIESTALVFVEQTPVRDDHQLDLAVSQLSFLVRLLEDAFFPFGKCRPNIEKGKSGKD